MMDFSIAFIWNNVKHICYVIAARERGPCIKKILPYTQTESADNIFFLDVEAYRGTLLQNYFGSNRSEPKDEKSNRKGIFLNQKNSCLTMTLDQQVVVYLIILLDYSCMQSPAPITSPNFKELFWKY